MRNYFALLIILLFLALTIALSRAAERAVDAYTALEERPYSAVDVVLESRQTPPVSSPAERNQAGWLALGLVAVAAVIALLRTGSDFLRQMRLLRRRQPLRQPRPSPTQPPLPGEIPPVYPPSVPRIPPARPADNIPSLPPGEPWESGD